MVLLLRHLSMALSSSSSSSFFLLGGSGGGGGGCSHCRCWRWQRLRRRRRHPPTVSVVGVQRETSSHRRENYEVRPPSSHPSKMSSDKIIDGFADSVVTKIVMVSKLNAETSIKHFVTRNEIIDNTNLKDWYKKYVNDKILVKFEEFQEKDSVVCALYPAPKDKNVSRVSSYPHFTKVLKLGNIKFPIALKDIAKFEQLNGLAINVFTVVDKEVTLLLSKSRDCQDWFANELHQTALELNYIFNNPKPMKPLDVDERQTFMSSLTCHICERPFKSESDKVMDHDHFTDSFRFMSSSLSKLSSYLDNNQKTVTRQYFNDDAKFELVTRKGVFPYEYLDCWEKLTERNLPPQSAFFSKINNETITDADYSHACYVWQTFKIENLQEYAELYLKTDVLLLTDVFENFRDMCMKTYKLDALHYYTAPGLAFDAMLKITNVNLELMTDIEMATFIQKGIRGGISQCCNRYGEANNPYMGKHYKPDVVTSYLMYYDINNLYGAVMSKHLPYGGFEWVPVENIYHENILNQPDDSEYGYILEVDLEYPVMSTDYDWSVSKKAKGIQRSALKEITFDDYYKCLMDRTQVEIQQNFITTSKHNVYTVAQKKVALSPYDDKRMEQQPSPSLSPPPKKRAKQRIVPSPVDTTTPPDPFVVVVAATAAMVKTNLTSEDARYEQQLWSLLRQPLVKYNLTRLYAVCDSRQQLSKTDLARLFSKTPEAKAVPLLVERHFAQFQLPNPPEDSDYDSDDTIAE
ncbi:unnamed protein product [Callosobruchus maculatus]|uniref:DNA-directed DNA polymerase n=1 Tax=Callosobruchus maculatus TaxID=64391 RepID=A0A653D4X5_CALMS|nr:unnamed protein product [Callosobruchus maculatus]